MSHTNQTPNLQLAQFVANDKPTWLGDWNSTILTIDNAVGNIQEDLSTTEGLVAELSSGVSSLTTEVDKVKPDNAGLDGNVLKKTSTGATWSTLEASTIGYNTSTVDAELNKVNNQISLIGATDANNNQAINVASGSATSLAQLTLSEGVYVVNAYAQFSDKNTGMRSLSISTNNQIAPSWNEGRVDVPPAPQGTTKIMVSKIFTVNTPTTLYCLVAHNAGTTLSCNGALEYVKIK